jgi:glycerophosphoryl diester phosphodiesterase
LPEKVAVLVKKHNLQDSIIFSSFLPKTLIRIRRLFPKIPAGILALPGVAGVFSRSIIGKWISPELVHPYFTDVNLAFVIHEHNRHRKVNVWTVDTEQEIQEMMQVSVDGIITDDVPLALGIRNEQGAWDKG